MDGQPILAVTMTCSCDHNVMLDLIHKDQRNPTDGLDPLQFGWMKNLSDRFTPDWFTGSSIPSNLLNQEVINEYEELEEYHEDDGWSTDSSSDYDL